MSDDLKKKTVPLCVVCAQPASNFKCAKCKVPYCSVSCQTEDWKKRGHKKTCKRLVKEKAEAAVAGDASRDEAPTPPPSPKAKAAPPVVDGPACGRADVARARAAAAAATATTVRAPEPEHYRGSPRCPVCLEDWDVNGSVTIRACCCKYVCTPCNNKLVSASLPCPLCRTPSPSSNEEILARFRRKVENDNPAAMRFLGSCYEFSNLGVVKSYKKAARLYQRAADLGDVDAMYNIGVAYWNGVGVKLDKKKAVKYYRMAADRGIAKAQFNLGICYGNGDGVAQDYAEAMRYYRLAADQGYSLAEFNLGIMYENGYGVTRDTAEAIRWCERAAAKGDEGAIAALARLRRSLRP